MALAVAYMTSAVTVALALGEGVELGYGLGRRVDRRRGERGVLGCSSLSAQRARPIGSSLPCDLYSRLPCAHFMLEASDRFLPIIVSESRIVSYRIGCTFGRNIVRYCYRLHRLIEIS